MNAMSLINEFLLSSTDLSPVPFSEAPQSPPDNMAANLFAQIFYDIAVQHYGVSPDDVLCGRIWGDGIDTVIGIKFIVDETLPTAVRTKTTAALRMLLRDIEVEDHQNQLWFDTDDLGVLYADKMNLYTVLTHFLDNNGRTMLMPDDIEFRKRYSAEYRSQQITEYMHIHARKAHKEAAETPGRADAMFLSVQTAPYVSTTHFNAAMHRHGVAEISISRNHLLKTICYEDGAPLPPEPFGGHEKDGVFWRRGLPTPSGGYN